MPVSKDQQIKVLKSKLAKVKRELKKEFLGAQKSIECLNAILTKEQRETGKLSRQNELLVNNIGQFHKLRNLTVFGKIQGVVIANFSNDNAEIDENFNKIVAVSLRKEIEKIEPAKFDEFINSHQYILGKLVERKDSSNKFLNQPVTLILYYIISAMDYVEFDSIFEYDANSVAYMFRDLGKSTMLY